MTADLNVADWSGPPRCNRRTGTGRGEAHQIRRNQNAQRLTVSVMKAMLLISVIFGLLAASVEARLDETEPQLIDRYGHVRIRTTANVATLPQRPAGETLVFCVDGWTVTALVIDGRCKVITYLKPGEWTEEQLWHILEANGGHAQWEEMKTSAPDLKREWKRRDRTVAVWQQSRGIELMSPLDERRREELARGHRGDVARLDQF
jgi:hypothetical protein